MIEILDCTIRDGGYYTNWDFSEDVIETYFNSINQLPIDYVEVGYRSLELASYYGKYFYLPEYVMKHLHELSTKKLVIILNEKDVRAENADLLLTPCKPFIHTVRLAVAPENFTRALNLAEKVRSMGFQVCFNLMYMSTWGENNDLVTQFKELNGVVDILYMVDSFGGVYPEDVKSTYRLIKEYTDVKVGFHGHNNLELALVNTLTAVDCGVDIVDSTVTGMGRGAGNLSTELLLTVLQSKDLASVDFNMLSQVVDVFNKLKSHYHWGTDLPYMVSGANSLPQKNVMNWMSKRHYSKNSIIRALTNESKGVEDNDRLPELQLPKNPKVKRALLVGGGSSVVDEEEAINLFLQKAVDMPIIHASPKNAFLFKEVENLQYFCLIGNEGHRLEKVFKSKEDANGLGVLPPYPREMGTYVPNMMEGKTFELKDFSMFGDHEASHTSIALQLASELGVEELYVVGYDGYNAETLNSIEQGLYMENTGFFETFYQKLSIKPIALTPTKYKGLKQESIFSKI